MTNLRERVLTVARALGQDPKDWIIEESVVKDPPIPGKRCRVKITPPGGPYVDALRVVVWKEDSYGAADFAWKQFSHKVSMWVRHREEAVLLANTMLKQARAALVEVEILNLPA